MGYAIPRYKNMYLDEVMIGMQTSTLTQRAYINQCS